MNAVKAFNKTCKSVLGKKVVKKKDAEILLSFLSDTFGFMSGIMVVDSVLGKTKKSESKKGCKLAVKLAVKLGLVEVKEIPGTDVATRLYGIPITVAATTDLYAQLQTRFKELLENPTKRFLESLKDNEKPALDDQFTFAKLGLPSIPLLN